MFNSNLIALVFYGFMTSMQSKNVKFVRRTLNTVSVAFLYNVLPIRIHKRVRYILLTWNTNQRLCDRIAVRLQWTTWPRWAYFYPSWWVPPNSQCVFSTICLNNYWKQTKYLVFINNIKNHSTRNAEIILLISSLGINTWTLVHDHYTVFVGKVHDFFCVRVMRCPVRIRSDPLDEVVISCHQRVIHSFTPYLKSPTTIIMIIIL